VDAILCCPYFNTNPIREIGDYQLGQRAWRQYDGHFITACFLKDGSRFS
jgi:hypothetical protein